MKNDLNLNISNGKFQFDASDHDEFIRHLTRTPVDDQHGYTAYSFENWTFWISPDKSNCRFHMRLRYEDNSSKENEIGKASNQPK